MRHQRLWGVVVGCVVGGLTGQALAADYWVGTGPHATHTSIQAAIDSVVSGDDRDSIVHVAAGWWDERPAIVGLTEGRTLIVSGGWNPAAGRVHERWLDAASGNTIIDGQARAPAFLVALSAGSIILERLIIQKGGGAVTSGGGVQLRLSGSARAGMQRVIVRDNLIRGADSATGGGLDANLYGRAELHLGDVLFLNNAAIADGVADSGGAFVFLHEQAHLTMRDCDFIENGVHGGQDAVDAALRVTVQDGATATLDGLTFLGNRASSDLLEGRSIVGLSVEQATRTEPQLSAERFELRGNVVDPRGQQVTLMAPSGALRFADSLVLGDGDQTGILAFPAERNVHVVNVTVVGNTHRSIESVPETATGRVWIANSILLGRRRGSMSRWRTMLEDPGFVDASAGDYHLDAFSPEIDAGRADHRTGLSARDLDGEARVQGESVDLGAYEAGHPALRCFVRPGVLAPDVPNACRCMADAGLRMTRCRFFVPGLILESRFPLDWKDLAALRWTIDAWRTPLEVLPPAIEWLVDGKWVAGKTKQEPAELVTPDKPWQQQLSLPESPSAPSGLRGVLRYRVPGSKAVEAVQFGLPLVPTASQIPAIPDKR